MAADSGDDRDPISIHAPVKGATGAVTAAHTITKISIHPPVKGATRVRGNRPNSVTFQSTLP